MGTELIARGLVLPENTASWNLTHPDAVRAVHESWLAAGARLLVTNTFAAAWLGAAERGAAIRAAVRLSREALGSQDFEDTAGPRVLGNVGPSGDPAGSRAVIAELAAAGVDGLLVESMRGEGELRAALEAARAEAPGLPVLVSGLSVEGPERGEAALGFGRLLGALAAEHGAAAVGVNCTLAPEPLGAVWRGLEPCGLPRFARAGILAPVEPQVWARAVLAAAPGAAMLGGCCGTTPAHLRALAACLEPR